MFKFVFEKFKILSGKFDIFSLGNSLLLYYLIIFGVLPLAMFLKLPSRITKYVGNQISLLLYPRVILNIILAIAFMYLGYLLAGYLLKRIRITSVFKSGDIGQKRFFIVFSFVFIAGLAIKIIRILGGAYFHLLNSGALTLSSFYSIIGLLDWLGPASLAMIFAYYYRLKKSGDIKANLLRNISWIVFGVEFCFGFFSGSRFLAAIPVIVFLIVRHYSFKKSLLSAIIGCVLIFFVIMPATKFYSEHQYILPEYFPTSTNLSQKDNKTLENTQKFVLDNFVGRVDQSRILIATLNNTGPSLGKGTFFTNFLISLGPPRFIWHSKPVTNADGNSFGKQIGILNADDTTTSIAPTNIGDLYMNFGIWGIIIGMMILGAFARLVFDQFIERSGNSISGIMTYSVFWIQIIKGSEDWIAPVYSGLVKLFFIFFIIHIALYWKFRKEGEFEN